MEITKFRINILGIRDTTMLYLIKSRANKNVDFIISERDYHSGSMINTVLHKGTRKEIFEYLLTAQ